MGIKGFNEEKYVEMLENGELYDYITNLQQENERLNDVLVHKPDEKIILKTNDGQELFFIQSERIDMQEELNKANMQLMTQLEDYKSRIDKAIKYIQDENNQNDCCGYEVVYIDEILNILEGKENDI